MNCLIWHECCLCARVLRLAPKMQRYRIGTAPAAPVQLPLQRRHALSSNQRVKSLTPSTTSEAILAQSHILDHSSLFGSRTRLCWLILGAGRRRDHSTARCWTLISAASQLHHHMPYFGGRGSKRSGESKSTRSRFSICAERSLSSASRSISASFSITNLTGR